MSAREKVNDLLKQAGAVLKRKRKHDKKVETASLAQSLRMAGLTDDALRDRMSTQETRMCELERRLEAAESLVTNSWAHRLERWFKSRLGEM